MMMMMMSHVHRWVSEWVSEWASERASERGSEWVSERGSEWGSEGVSEGVSEWASERVSKWVSELCVLFFCFVCCGLCIVCCALCLVGCVLLCVVCYVLWEGRDVSLGRKVVVGSHGLPLMSPPPANVVSARPKPNRLVRTKASTSVLKQVGTYLHMYCTRLSQLREHLWSVPADR